MSAKVFVLIAFQVHGVMPTRQAGYAAPAGFETMIVTDLEMLLLPEASRATALRMPVQ